MEDLTTEAKNQDTSLLWHEPEHPTPLARRASGRSHAEGPVDRPSRGGGSFEHCGRILAVTKSLARLRYQSLGSSEIDEHALGYQGRVLGNATAGPVGSWDVPIGELTPEEKGGGSG